jgi:hypothetical protein
MRRAPRPRLMKREEMIREIISTVPIELVSVSIPLDRRGAPGAESEDGRKRTSCQANKCEIARIDRPDRKRGLVEGA